MSDNALLLLSADGELRYIDPLVDALRLTGMTTPAVLDSDTRNDIAKALVIVIEFESSADGRGFSLARHLRVALDYSGTLYAAGDIIPDQVNMALDCGCDGVLVDAGRRHRYGEESWQQSCAKSGDLSYWSSGRTGSDSVWNKRALIAGSTEQL